ncbi:MAG TPA: adenylate/guanylate cyclase domain-containing protein [Xanthobacteraceae bacterium]|jgi:class 3 adenylate cyclase|nr:adenylate/guanylate cyclase domain-containing protein [Xanthobacteraceae bacterium]
MKRKIAAIFAADIAGYSKLVAEDEEETLRRLASYREVMDDFIARAGGRIFNTAGDAVLAEFSSAVEAVRCAIDIQESLRTRNMAYPASRQMCFRIGITVGDVVERDGDLLGDGVNIAARLEGIAPIGGICISRTVHEQVANKLSVQFADIGEQQVKNIPTPVHAYHISMRPDDAQADAKPKPATTPAVSGSWMIPAAIAGLCAVLLVAGGGLAYKLLQPGAPQATSRTAGDTAPQAATGDASASAPSANAPAASGPRAVEALVPDTIPFITDRARAAVREEYMSADAHKALAISAGPIGISSGQADDEAAKAAALDVCQKRADALPAQRKCEIYAVGGNVVYGRGRPPMPPTPWVTQDSAIESPLVAANIPMMRETGKTSIERNYLPARMPKALALGPQGGFFFYTNQQSADEAVRRVLELCGSAAGVPCLIVAVDNNFVVPVPITMKATGFFRPAGADAIAPGLREEVAHRLGNGSGWTAVAAGATGRAGIAQHAANEQAAIDTAMADCSKQDSSCRVIAIGPFAVEGK